MTPTAMKRHSASFDRPSTKPAEVDTRYVSRTISKALATLEPIQTQSAGRTMNSIAQQLGLSKTSAFRILRTLEVTGHVVPDGNDYTRSRSGTRGIASRKVGYFLADQIVTPSAAEASGRSGGGISGASQRYSPSSYSDVGSRTTSNRAPFDGMVAASIESAGSWASGSTSGMYVAQGWLMVHAIILLTLSAWRSSQPRPAGAEPAQSRPWSAELRQRPRL